MKNKKMEEIEIVKKLTHKFIFERKKTLGCSNYKLAQLTKMSRQTIDSFEKDYMHNLTLDSYLRLCGALEIILLDFNSSTASYKSNLIII